MKNIVKLNNVNTDDMAAIEISVYENQLYIDRVFNKVPGAFKKIWNDVILPYCKNQNITVVSLTDSQITDRDVWGEDYGFSGRKGSGQRYSYLNLDDKVSINRSAMNTIINTIIVDKANDRYDPKYIMRLVERFNLSDIDLESCYSQANVSYINRITKGECIEQIIK